MMPAVAIEHPVENSVRLNFEVEDEDQDLTGATIRFRVYNPDGTVLTEKTTGTGITITGPRTYSVDLRDGTSYAFPAGRYWYNVRITAPLAMASLRAHGPYSVSQERLT